jgi:hypothetical protein
MHPEEVEVAVLTLRSLGVMIQEQLVEQESPARPIRPEHRLSQFSINAGCPSIMTRDTYWIFLRCHRALAEYRDGRMLALVVLLFDDRQAAWVN